MPCLPFLLLLPVAAPTLCFTVLVRGATKAVSHVCIWCHLSYCSLVLIYGVFGARHGHSLIRPSTSFTAARSHAWNNFHDPELSLKAVTKHLIKRIWFLTVGDFNAQAINYYLNLLMLITFLSTYIVVHFVWYGRRWTLVSSCSCVLCWTTCASHVVDIFHTV